MSKKVSLVLSGGGARGIAHIGVIETLEKEGYEIVSITGTSMGSLVGGVYVLGKLPEFKEWLLGLDKLKVFNLIDFTFSKQGLVKGDRVFNALKSFIEDRPIEELEIPYAAVAVDLLNKKEVLFNSGSILEAIRASVSIPTVFTPVNKDNTFLIDGGILNNLPVNYAQRQPGDILIAVNVNAEVALEKPKQTDKTEVINDSLYLKRILQFKNQLQKLYPAGKENTLGYFELITQTIGLMTERIVQANLEKYPPDILINISRKSSEVFDFYKAKELVDIGQFAAKKALKNYIPHKQ